MSAAIGRLVFSTHMGDELEKAKVVLDTGVWIELKGDLATLEHLDSFFRNQGIEVLVPTTLLKELTGCHLNEKYRAENIQALSFVKHKFVEDSFTILDETAMDMGRLAGEEDALTYGGYLADPSVRKRRDLVIAKTAKDSDAKLVWHNSSDKQRLIENGIEKTRIVSLEEIFNVPN